MEINLLTILKTIQHNKRTLFLVTLSAFVLSTAIAFLLPVYYKSTCIFYPLNPKSYDPRMRFSNNIELYGGGEDADRTLILAESGQIADFIIKKYDLAKRYEYDTSSALDLLKLKKEYYSNLEIEENNKGAISISFYDQNPDTAAFIVRDMVKQINEINKSVIIDANLKQYTLYKNWMDEKYAGLDSLSEILGQIKKQQSGTTEQGIIALEMFNTYSKFKEAQVNLEAIQDDISTIHIIEEAAPIVKKAKPKRMILVGLSTVAAFVLVLLFLLIKEQPGYKELMEDKEE